MNPDNFSTGDPSKDDIVKCIVQLANRCEELGYTQLQSSLFTIAGASLDSPKAERDVASVLYQYAQIRLMVLKMEEQLEEEDEDSEDEK